MKRRHRDPNDPEVQQAVLERIRRMTRADWERVNQELSHAPEGVEDPWPPYKWPERNGAGPETSENHRTEALLPDGDACEDPATPVTAER